MKNWPREYMKNVLALCGGYPPVNSSQCSIVHCKATQCCINLSILTVSKSPSKNSPQLNLHHLSEVCHWMVTN